MTLRSKLPVLLVGAVLGVAVSSASVASAAESGTIVLTDGTSLAGEIVELVQGDHLALKLPNGQLKTIAWSQIGTMQIGASGSIVIGGGNTAAPPPAPTTAPPPPIVYAPAPAAPPPPVVYAPPPPAPYYAPAPPPPPPPERFRPRWTVGGRLSAMWIGKADIVGATNNGADGNNISQSSLTSGGLALEGDVGLHFSPAWTLYGFWEHGFLGRGEVNGSTSGDQSTDFVGLGFNANTNPDGPIGFYFDVAAGWRWLTVNVPGYSPNGVAVGLDSRRTYNGFEALRLGLGMAIVVNPTFRLDILLSGSAGYFSHVDGDGACPVTNDGSACGNIPSERRAVHSFGTLSVGGHWDLL